MAANENAPQDYDIEEHRHRFAVWAAARSVAPGFTSTANVRRAIEASKLRAIAFSGPSKWPKEGFDDLHEELAERILSQLENDGVFKQNSTVGIKPKKAESYGRAAKIIAIYFKTILLMGCDSDRDFVSLIHPPIDRTLLQKLSQQPEFAAHRSLWSSIRWTRLTKDAYIDVIKSFREAGLAQHGFWRIERYWQPERESLA